MLVLSRTEGESIIFGDREIVVTVMRLGRDRVRLGIEAPASMSVHREEVYRAIKREGNSLTQPPEGP